jgi:hypothetical protein
MVHQEIHLILHQVNLMLFLQQEEVLVVLHQAVVEHLEDQVVEVVEQLLVLQLLDLEEVEFVVKEILADMVVTIKVYLVQVVEQALLVVIK